MTLVKSCRSLDELQLVDSVVAVEGSVVVSLVSKNETKIIFFFIKFNFKLINFKRNHLVFIV